MSAALMELPEDFILTDGWWNKYLKKYPKTGPVRIMRSTKSFQKGKSSKYSRARPITSQKGKDFVMKCVNGAKSFPVAFGGEYHFTNDMPFQGLFVVGLFTGKHWKDACILTRQGMMSPHELSKIYTPGSHSSAHAIKFAIIEDSTRRYISLSTLVKEKYLVPLNGKEWRVCQSGSRVQSTPRPGHSESMDHDFSFRTNNSDDEIEDPHVEIEDPPEAAFQLPAEQATEGGLGQAADQNVDPSDDQAAGGDSTQEINQDDEPSTSFTVKMEIGVQDSSAGAVHSADAVRMDSAPYLLSLHEDEKKECYFDIVSINQRGLKGLVEEGRLDMVSTTWATHIEDFSLGRPCDFCAPTFRTLADHSLHLATEHKSRITYRVGRNYTHCIGCHPNATFFSVITLFAHLEQHHFKVITRDYFWAGSQRAIFAKFSRSLDFESQFKTWNDTVNAFFPRMVL